MSIHRIFSVLAVLSCLSGIARADSLPFYGTSDFTPTWLDANDSSLEDFHQVAPFSLVDQHGDVIDSAVTDGRIYVASFFFSTCPGICPTLRSKLSRVQDAFVNEERVKILSHSIRPTTDTVEILKHYAASNGVTSPNWHLLTGSQTEIYRLAKESYFASEDFGEESSLEDFLHTENLLLVDQNRRIRGVYNGLNDTSVGYLIDDIEQLLKVEAAREPIAIASEQSCH